MKINRRNTIIGLGTIVAGGGAALGSGAFSQAEASRQIDVNVIDDQNIAGEFTDILVQTGNSDSVGINSSSDATQAEDTFPTSQTEYNATLDSANATDVSLLANDVTIVFGMQSEELPPNAVVSFDDLFRVVNDEPNSGASGAVFNVEFSSESDAVDNFTDSGGSKSATVTEENISEGEDAEVGIDINTTEETGEITIKITEV